MAWRGVLMPSSLQNPTHTRQRQLHTYTHTHERQTLTCTKAWRGVLMPSSLLERSRADTMPAVTVRRSISGEPSAQTHSPTFSLFCLCRVLVKQGGQAAIQP